MVATTARQLIGQLMRIKPNAKIYLSSDEEGNSYAEGVEVNFNEQETRIFLFPNGKTIQPEDMPGATDQWKTFAS